MNRDATTNLITEPIHRLRRRERLIAFAWGVGRWLTVVMASLAVACFVDWWVDRRRDTPHGLRIGLLIGQAAIALIAAIAWVVVPIFRRRPDDELALYAENQRPELGHRLISAVQLTRSNAAIAGMSPSLISALAVDAVAKIKTIHFPALADHRRLPWAGALAAATAVFAAVALAVAPDTVYALVARQLLSDATIPRRIHVTDATPTVQPSAEPVTIVLAVEGGGPYDGELRIAADAGHVERVPLDVEPEDGRLTVKLPAPANDFSFEAWVGDGRLKQPGHVRLVPRPAVVDLNAALILPRGIGVRPDGLPYEQPLARGEVVGIDGCSARVTVRTQKPIQRAEMEIFGPVDPVAGAPPAVVRLLPMKLMSETVAEVIFDLRDGETSYRVLVRDEYAFRNLDPPRRDLRLVPEEPPLVTLLPEQFRPEGTTAGSSEEFEVDGVPVPLGGGIRIGYTGTHPYGLGKAVLVYRINEDAWRRLPLTEAKATPETGPFDPRRGCFLRSRPTDQVQFYAVPSPDPARQPERIEGGGRFDFQTRALPGLKVGDQIEYFVEVTNRQTDQPLAGRSETRAKKVVTVAELVEWIDGALRQEDRIRRLAERQRGIFDPRARSDSP